VAVSDSHSKREVLDVLARREHTLLHLLEIVWLQPVGDVVDVLAAAGLHVAGQGSQEDHGVVLVARELMNQLPKHVKLAFSIQELQYTIDVVCTGALSSPAGGD
jgi:hypothetical protein